MAINPNNEYPSNTNTPTSEYPYGSARNVTTPNDGTGTPWEENIINDVLGFQQAILSEAGLTPNATPDTALNSQYLQGIKKILQPFATVDAMKNMDPAEAARLASYNAVVSTVVNNTTSNKGGAGYIIKTAAQVTADGDVIDGIENHWLLGGTSYAAVMIDRSIAEISCYGATQGDAASIKSAVESALARSKVCNVPEGTWEFDDVSIPAFSTIKGVGRRKSIINATGTIGFHINGDHITFQDVTISSSASQCGFNTTNSNCSYLSWYNVFFTTNPTSAGRVAEFNNLIYYGRAVGCDWRDCYEGWVFTAGQLLNAYAFEGCTFYHFNPTSGKFAIQSEFAQDGVSFNGCSIQNQPLRFKDCNGIVWVGGYIEGKVGANVETLSLENTEFTTDGTYTPSGHITIIDDASYRKSSGRLPANSRFMPWLRKKKAKNIFPYPRISASDAISYIDNGVTGAGFSSEVWDAGGFITFTSAASTDNAGFKADIDARGIAVYAKIKVNSGTLKVVTYNVSSPTSVTYQASANFQYVRLWDNYNGSRPGFYFARDGATNVEFELHELVVTSEAESIANPEDFIQESNLFIEPVSFFGGVSGDITTGNTGVFSSGNWGSTVLTGGGGATTLKTMTGSDLGMYLVTFVTDNIQVPIASGLVWVDFDGDVTYTSIASGTLLTFSASGKNLQGSYSGGGTRTVTPTIIKIY